MDYLIGHSITYRVAVGPRAGQQVFALQSVPARSAEPRPGVAQCAGFSLHAGIGVEADQRAKLERLARYVSRPPVAVERLALTAQGQVRYRLKTPYRDGTTHIVLEPVDFMARLAALVPPPRAHLTRFHGVFAPQAALRAAVTPAGRGARRIRRLRRSGRGRRRRAHRECCSESDCRRHARCGGRARGGVLRAINAGTTISREAASKRSRGGHGRGARRPDSRRASPRTARRYTRRRQSALLSVLFPTEGRIARNHSEC